MPRKKKEGPAWYGPDWRNPPRHYIENEVLRTLKKYPPPQPTPEQLKKIRKDFGIAHLFDDDGNVL